MDYTEVFDDIFEMYLKKWEMLQVKTCNMGSLYRLEYAISLKQVTDEKEFIDELRCRNGNLEISCSRVGLGERSYNGSKKNCNVTRYVLFNDNTCWLSRKH